MIQLPGERIEVESLTIDKPVTLEGKPGSTLLVNGGSILVSFVQSGDWDKGNETVQSKMLINSQLS